MKQVRAAKKFGRVAVFLGGRSHERSISLRSGEAVYQALKSAGVDVIKIDTANGFKAKLKAEPVDLAFLALHGTGGEDGTIQKILNRSRIPYVGSGPKASASAFNKATAKRLFLRLGIPTPSYEVVTAKNWARKLKKWNPPYVVKPVREGSSIGVSFVDRLSEARQKIQSTLKNYPQLLIERKIEGREFTVGILGEKALPVIELKPKRAFYDYKAKYTKGMTEYLVPAPISRSLTNQLQSIALRAHRAIGLRDLSRVDFKVDSAGHPFVLEVNSIPGFTEMSLLPKAAKHIGLEFNDLCVGLLEMAQSRSGPGKDQRHG